MDPSPPALPVAPAPPRAEGMLVRLVHAPAVRALLLPLLLWSIPGLVSATQLSLYLRLKEPDFTFRTALLWQYPPWLVWGLATPLILALGRRLPLEPGRWRRRVPAHVLAALAIHGVNMGVVVLMGVLARPQSYGEEPFARLWLLSTLKMVHQAFLFYGGVLALGFAREYYRRYREGELAQAHLQAQLAHAQLDALKMQLHPHFLFNTLHAISVLVRKQDTAAAVRMIAGVGELLRLALANTGRQTVPLRQELDFIERYLALEQMRFQDRLQVHRAIEPAVLDAAVPNLLLQPLVENALKHGIAARAAAGRVELEARRLGEWLQLAVRDDGPGLGADWEEGGGIGLANVRARLEQLYGARHLLRLESHPEGGVRVVVQLPLVVQEAA